MKIRTNFTFDFDRLLPSLLGAAWILSAFALGLGVWIIQGSLSLSHGLPALRQEAAALAAKPTPVPAPAALTPKAMADLLRQANKINALGAVEGRPPASVLARLEKILPGGARCLSFQEDCREGTLQLVVEAVNLEELSRFLSALESDDSFSKVTLTKQSQAQTGNANWIQFAVDLRENRP